MKRGPERLQRRPDHGRPIVDPQFKAILDEARRELERQTTHPGRTRYDGADPLDLPTYRAPHRAALTGRPRNER